MRCCCLAPELCPIACVRTWWEILGEKECKYIYAWLGHFSVQQKLAQLCTSTILFFFSFLFFCFLGPYPRHMEVPRLWVELELQPLPYTAATATRDSSHVCSLHHRSWQCQIPNPTDRGRDWTRILMDTSWIYFRCTTMGTPKSPLL